MQLISPLLIVIFTGCLLAGCSKVNPHNAKGIQMTEQTVKDPNEINQAGDPIIFEAIGSADISEVVRLIEAGADIEKQGFGYQTPALRAASARQWDICLYLLKQGANPTVADHSGITIPYLAFTSNIYLHSYQGPYWAEVKAFLKQRNLDVLNIPPKQVRELQAAGEWPPVILPKN